MKRKATKTDQRLMEAAERALRGDNLATDEMGNAAKPLSFYPLKTGTALAALLKVKPAPKRTKKV